VKFTQLELDANRQALLRVLCLCFLRDTNAPKFHEKTLKMFVVKFSKRP